MNSLYLAHHGIKGQKWGVRRWQNDDGSLTDAGRKHYGYGDGRRNSSIEVVSKSGKKSSGYSDKETEEEKKKFKLTYKQKRNIAIGVGVVATCLAAYGFYRYMNPRDLSNIDLSKNPNFDEVTGLLKKTSKSTLLEDAVAVNPKEDLTNCAKCSAAYELRRRGYDVVAGKHADADSFVQNSFGIRQYFDYKDGSVCRSRPLLDEFNETHKKEFEALKQKIGLNTYSGEPLQLLNYKDGKAGVYLNDVNDRTEIVHSQFRKTCPSMYKDMIKQSASSVDSVCHSYGPNARGQIEIPHFINGHSIAFENDELGNTTIIDSQVSFFRKERSKFNSMLDYLTGTEADTDFDAFSGIVVRRTDNAEPNFKYLVENNVVENNIPDNFFDKIAKGGRYANALLAEASISSAFIHQKNMNKNKKKQKKERK